VDLFCPAVTLSFADAPTLAEPGVKFEKPATRSFNVNRGSKSFAEPEPMDLKDSPIPVPIEAIPVPVSVRAAPVPSADCGRTRALTRKAPTKPKARKPVSRPITMYYQKQNT
jgi:hypothetical protein